MSGVLEQGQVCAHEQIKSVLSQAVSELDIASMPEGDILRFELSIPPINFFNWLACQPPNSSGYWSDRESGFELIGIGKADVLTGETVEDYTPLMEELHRRIHSSEKEVRYFGGIQFMEDQRHEEAWERFKGYRFILPRFEILHRNGLTLFALNICGPENLSQVMQEIEALTFEVKEVAFTLPKAFGRTNTPSRGDWIGVVDKALEHIRAGDLEKIVLARKSSVFFNGPLNPVSLLWHLRENTGQRFHFCFQPVPGNAFVGASPERLYRRDGNKIATEALAGTRPKGHNLMAEQSFEEELLHDQKELREHQYVVDEIRQILSGLTNELESDAYPRVLKLTASQHLATRFNGILKEGVKDADILKALHPTPAVGGYPTEAALELLKSLEHFHRGWYAAPVGWITRDAAQFAVGIRSALVDEAGMYMYSGAGIVEGSHAEAEWDEIENKVADLKALFGF